MDTPNLAPKRLRMILPIVGAVTGFTTHILWSIAFELSGGYSRGSSFAGKWEMFSRGLREAIDFCAPLLPGSILFGLCVGFAVRRRWAGAWLFVSSALFPVLHAGVLGLLFAMLVGGEGVLAIALYPSLYSTSIPLWLSQTVFLLSFRRRLEDARPERQWRLATRVVFVLLGVPLLIGAGIGYRAFSSEDVFSLARRGDREGVRRVLAQGTSPNLRDRENIPLIFYAILGSHWDIARDLIEAGADVNSKILNGDSVLSAAGSHANAEFVSFLIAHGVDVKNDGKAFGFSLRSPVILGLLIDAGADFQKQPEAWPLFTAIDNRDLAVVRLLVDRGANVNAQRPAVYNDSPLMRAMDAEKVEIIKFLLEKGADRSLKDRDGRTALDIAKIRGCGVCEGLLNGSESSKSQ